MFYLISIENIFWDILNGFMKYKTCAAVIKKIGGCMKKKNT